MQECSEKRELDFGVLGRGDYLMFTKIDHSIRNKSLPSIIYTSAFYSKQKKIRAVGEKIKSSKFTSIKLEVGLQNYFSQLQALSLGDNFGY